MTSRALIRPVGASPTVAPHSKRPPLTRGDVLTPEEVGEILGVSRKTVTRWALAGAIPAHRAGLGWRFYRQEIDDWLRSN